MFDIHKIIFLKRYRKYEHFVTIFQYVDHHYITQFGHVPRGFYNLNGKKDMKLNLNNMPFHFSDTP
jgi:hypothetical protein